jgi:hypothetical protein
LPAPEQFISEPVTPAPGTFDTAMMARGEAGLPGRFTWRGREYTVARLLASWKSSTADRGEMYLRRHWFKITTTDGQTMTLYCDRQAKNAKRPTRRWWLYTIEEGSEVTSARGRDSV